MSSIGFRVKKSRSILISLYSISGVAGLVYLLLFVFSLAYLLPRAVLTDSSMPNVFYQSIQLTWVALVLALPFAFVITTSILIEGDSKKTLITEKSLSLTYQFPFLLYGTAVLFIFGWSTKSYLFILWLLAVGLLSKRWIHLSRKINVNELEAALSLGMNFVEVLGVIYMGQFFYKYLAHGFVVFCDLLFMVTPFLCIAFYQQSEAPLIAVELFKRIGAGSGDLALFVFIFCIIHLLKFVTDQRISYVEVEHA